MFKSILQSSNYIVNSVKVKLGNFGGAWPSVNLERALHFMGKVGSPVSHLSTRALTFIIRNAIYSRHTVVVCATSWPSAADIPFFCSV